MRLELIQSPTRTLDALISAISELGLGKAVKGGSPTVNVINDIEISVALGMGVNVAMSVGVMTEAVFVWLTRAASLASRIR